MRPIKLEIQAFGSFAGNESVDFESLAHRGLFLVSGETGAGKTTIFDAMCWALFGKMPLKEAQEVRSDYVDVHVRTEVRFTFECGGERYVVTRNPEQLKEGARGRSVKESAHAYLERITDVGTEPVATKASETTKRCEELIGLDATQFQRVILLPQGEFSRFLLAGTGEREDLLSKLFGGSVFDDIVAELKDDKDRLGSLVGDVDRKLEGALDLARVYVERAVTDLGLEGFGLDERSIPGDSDDSVAPQPQVEDYPSETIEETRRRLGLQLAELEAPLRERGREVRRLAKAKKTALESLNAAVEGARRFDLAAEHREALAALDADRSRVETTAAAARMSQGARQICEAADELDTTNSAARTASDELNSSIERITTSFRAIGVDVIEPTRAALSRLLRDRRQLHSAQEKALETLTVAQRRRDAAAAGKQAAHEELEELGVRHDAATAMKSQIESMIPRMREAAVDVEPITARINHAKSLVEVRSDYDAALKDSLKAVQAAEEAAGRYGDALRRFVATQAPRLASTLEDDKPCPVCGSIDHPHPADDAGDSPITMEFLDEASRLNEAANATALKAQNRVSSLSGKLGSDIETPIEDIARQISDLESSRERAVAASVELHRLESALATQIQILMDLDAQRAALVERAEQADRDFVSAESEFDQASSDAAGLDADAVLKAGDALESLDVEISGLDGLFEQVTATDTSKNDAQKRLDLVLGASPFDVVADARAVLMSTESEVAALAALETHTSRMAEATSALTTIQSLGLPDERPDVDSASAAAKQAEGVHQDADHKLRDAEKCREDATSALADHDGLIAESGELREQAKAAELAHKVCQSGGPGLSMSLKRWVLTRELDRVTAAANLHLYRMTSGRYSLNRKVDRDDARRTFGLDLEVQDAMTGRPRSTRSLSGGEQFQASLALALGLADVVSHGGTSSGRVFEALFVDEGFGSLSKDALDDAVETLHQLHASGRMVGAITHVEDMKQSLHVGIEVKRLEDGRGSTLVVHP